MSLFAVGDIHGSYAALSSLFERQFFTPSDTIVFLGDYVDKGTQTKQVIDLLIEKSKSYNFIFLKGNHELMMERAKMASAYLFNWTQFGGFQTLDSYGIEDAPNWDELIPVEHWEFIEQCVPYYVKGNTIFVHAGLKANVALEDQNENDLFWKKYEFPEMYSISKTVICGHTARKNGQIANFDHTICIDTYAYGGQWLTCLNVDTGEYMQTNENNEFKVGILEMVSQ